MNKVSLELQPCLGERSGVGTYAYELSKRLKDTEQLSFQGNIFNFLNRHDNTAETAEYFCSFRENHILPYRAYRASQYFLPIPYDLLFGKADLNIFFNYTVPAGVTGKIITTVYDMTYMRYPETMMKRNYLRLKTGMEKAVSKADHIITISDFSKKEISSLLGIPTNRIEVIYCAAPKKGKSIDFSLISAKYKISKPYILFVGSIEPRKNLVRLIKAFDDLKNRKNIPHQLVLAGGKGWQNEAIFDAASSVVSRDRIIFTGFVSSEEKATLYENASLFAFPSVYEGFGIPPLEAMQWGCPVVCSNSASLPEAAGDAAEYVEAESVSSISEGIWKVLSEEGYANCLIEKGYKQIEKFSWDTSAAKLIDMCKKVLNGT